MSALLTRARLAFRAWQDAWSGTSTSILAWDASKGGSRLSRWVPPSTDFASAYVQPGLLKSRARDAYRNVSWARRAVDILAAYVIGCGIKPQLISSDAALKARVQALWTTWTDVADFASRFDFYGIQAQAFQAALVDGESLIRILPGAPLQIQILSSEYLDASRDNARNISGGIEFDSDGKRSAYWLFNRHPAQAVNPVSVRVPADQVIHLYAPLQPGVQRGVSWLASVLAPLYELRDYQESSLVRAKTGSLFCGYVRSQDGAGLTSDSGDPVFEPGSLCRLRPGDEVQFTTPPDPTQGYDPFVKSQLRSIAAGLNIPYELLSGDTSAITFASGRHSLLAFRRYCESVTHNLLVFSLCRPVWQWWVRLNVAMGELPEEMLTVPVKWIAQPVEMLDSRMEIESTVRRVRSGLLSRSEAVSQTGLDSETLDEEIARDNQRADRLGLVFDSDPRRVSQQGQEQQQGGADAATAA